MTDLTKLADALENIAHMEYPSGHHDGNNLREAARILRAAAGVDVAGLMDVADRYALAQADPAHWRSALESALRLTLAAREQAQPKENDAPKLWLWQNFVNGRPEYWAFDNPYPINLTDGDPQTLGEPCGYAIFKPSRQGRFDVSEERVLAAIARAAAAPKGTP